MNPFTLAADPSQPRSVAFLLGGGVAAAAAGAGALTGAALAGKVGEKGTALMVLGAMFVAALVVGGFYAARPSA